MTTKINTIGDSAFELCCKLRSVTLPRNLTTIGACAFRGSGLSSVLIPSSVTSIGEDAFLSCTRLKTIHVRAHSYAERYCKSHGLKSARK